MFNMQTRKCTVIRIKIGDEETKEFDFQLQLLSKYDWYNNFEMSPPGLYFEPLVLRLWHYFEVHRIF